MDRGHPLIALEARGLSRRFGARWVIEDLDLRLSPGERVGLIGANGAGKTTLLGLLAGTLAPHSGQIHLGGARIDRLSAAARARRGLARVFQADALSPGLTVAEHLRVAGADPGPWCERLRLGPKLRPQYLGRGGRRRLALALALARRPQVVLLDEPCAGLDEAERDELVAGLSGGPAVLWVEHDHRLLVAHTGRQLQLAEGALVPFVCSNQAPPPPVHSREAHEQAVVRVRLPGQPEIGLVAGDEAAAQGSAASVAGLSAPIAEVAFDGRALEPAPDARRRRGVGTLPSPPVLVPDLSVGAHLRLAGAGARDLLCQWLPAMAERLSVPAIEASGGEQRLLGLALALRPRPRLLVVEDPFTGLAPDVAARVHETLADERRAGVSILRLGLVQGHGARQMTGGQDDPRSA